MRPILLLVSLALVTSCSTDRSATRRRGAPQGGMSRYEARPPGLHFVNFFPIRAPRQTGVALRAGDRLAICGDSITEQRMHSRIMETYLTVAVPELRVDVRQYGWSGETAPGFLRRMTNDCLRFQPAIATTCYGMNDHGYQGCQADIGERYRAAMTGIVESFKNAGARVVLGSPGCVGKTPRWARDQTASAEALNLNLCELRNIDVDIAQRESVRFADDFATNPFSPAFERVDSAVAAKQAFETKQIKQLFHGEEGRRDREGTVTSSEKERAELVAAVRAAFEPVTHTLRIEPE